jgi:hypothetical protein
LQAKHSTGSNTRRRGESDENEQADEDRLDVTRIDRSVSEHENDKKKNKSLLLHKHKHSSQRQQPQEPRSESDEIRLPIFPHEHLLHPGGRESAWHWKRQGQLAT